MNSYINAYMNTFKKAEFTASMRGIERFENQKYRVTILNPAQG